MIINKIFNFSDSWNTEKVFELTSLIYSIVLIGIVVISMIYLAVTDYDMPPFNYILILGGFLLIAKLLDKMNNFLMTKIRKLFE
jgi:hypothetical protein